MNEPIIVSWYVNINQENEYRESAILVEVCKDNRGLFARVNDGGDGLKLVDLWRFDRESYEKVQAAFPEFWASNPSPASHSQTNEVTK